MGGSIFRSVVPQQTQGAESFTIDVQTSHCNQLSFKSSSKQALGVSNFQCGVRKGKWVRQIVSQRVFECSTCLILTWPIGSLLQGNKTPKTLTPACCTWPMSLATSATNPLSLADTAVHALILPQKKGGWSWSEDGLAFLPKYWTPFQLLQEFPNPATSVF